MRAFAAFVLRARHITRSLCTRASPCACHLLCAVDIVELVADTFFFSDGGTVFAAPESEPRICHSPTRLSPRNFFLCDHEGKLQPLQGVVPRAQALTACWRTHHVAARQRRTKEEGSRSCVVACRHT